MVISVPKISLIRSVVLTEHRLVADTRTLRYVYSIIFIVRGYMRRAGKLLHRFSDYSQKNFSLKPFHCKLEALYCKMSRSFYKRSTVFIPANKDYQ